VERGVVGGQWSTTPSHSRPPADPSLLGGWNNTHKLGIWHTVARAHGYPVSPGHSCVTLIWFSTPTATSLLPWPSKARRTSRRTARASSFREPWRCAGCGERGWRAAGQLGGQMLEAVEPWTMRPAAQGPHGGQSASLGPFQQATRGYQPSASAQAFALASLATRRWGSVSGQAASLNSRPRTSSIIFYSIRLRDAEFACATGCGSATVIVSGRVSGHPCP
jgi:hypothetical protein